MKKFQRRKLGKKTPKAVCRFKRDSLPSGPLIRSNTHQAQTDVKTKPSNHVDWQNSKRRSRVFCLKRNSLPRGTLIRSNIYQPQTDLRLYFLQILRAGKTAREDHEWRPHWEGQTVNAKPPTAVQRMFRCGWWWVQSKQPGVFRRISIWNMTLDVTDLIYGNVFIEVDQWRYWRSSYVVRMEVLP